ncbi:catalase, partial [Xanthomonas perforans]|nr:catalase [Xanthomonas perforans]
MVLALLAPTLIAPPVFAQSVLTGDNGAKVGDNQN